MDTDFINYIGLDNFKDNKTSSKYTKSISGNLTIDRDISEILSFSVSKKNINYKCIELFHDSNYDGECYNGNLAIINNYFELDFEYSSLQHPAKINLFNTTLYDTFSTSLDNFDGESLDVSLFINDLFCCVTNSNTIFYTINLTLSIDIF